MLSYLVQHAFAGLWGLVWHFGVAIGLAILCGVGAYFALKVGATRLAKFLIGCCLVCVALFSGEVIGVHMSSNRCAAQQRTTNAFVKKTVSGAQTKKARAARDPWDSPNN